MAADPKSKGNNLSSLILQPGWTIEGDGFGLITSRLTFICDAGSVAAKRPKSKEPHPEDARMQCHRSSYTVNANKIATITAEYVGLESGQMTQMQITGDVALGTQPIQAHKNFATGKAGDTGKPLKDLGWDSALNAFSESNNDAINYGLVGIKSFMYPEIQLTGTFYCATKAIVQDAQKMVGKTFERIAGHENMIMPQLGPVISKYHDRFGLMTGVSYEQFAHIYKVKISFRVAQGGWSNLVYDRYN